jgi:hypothetical protein
MCARSNRSPGMQHVVRMTWYVRTQKVGSNNLRRPPADSVTLPAHYAAAVTAVSEKMLVHQLAADADGLLVKTPKKGGSKCTHVVLNLVQRRALLSQVCGHAEN